MYSGRINERYYARNNTPSFYQFKDTYQFNDDQGRLYKIATKNRQVFENTKFKNKRARSAVQGMHSEPFINSYGFTKLYVKLGNPLTPWFGHKDIGKTLVLQARDGTNYAVVLKSHEKTTEKRRTGSIMVKGLDKVTLNRLLSP